MTKSKGFSERAYTTLDAYQAGFLTLRGYIPKLVNQGGKIVFVFIQSDELLQSLADYNGGAIVEAARFADAKILQRPEIPKEDRHQRDIWMAEVHRTKTRYGRGFLEW